MSGSSEAAVNCTLGQDRLILTALTLLRASNPINPNLGSLLAYFAPYLGGGSFTRGGQSSDSSKDCSDLSESEAALHDLFAEAGLSLGIGAVADEGEGGNGTLKLSLFELPGLMEGFGRAFTQNQ